MKILKSISEWFDAEEKPMSGKQMTIGLLILAAMVIGMVLEIQYQNHSLPVRIINTILLASPLVWLVACGIYNRNKKLPF